MDVADNAEFMAELLNREPNPDPFVSDPPVG